MVGIVVAVLGGLFLLISRFPFLGNLPGDIQVKREGLNFHIPCATSILLSIILTIIINIVIRFFIRR